MLTISSLNLADIGMYQCVAENKHGRIFTNAELRVIGKTKHTSVNIFSEVVLVPSFQSLLHGARLKCKSCQIKYDTSQAGGGAIIKGPHLRPYLVHPQS